MRSLSEKKIDLFYLDLPFATLDEYKAHFRLNCNLKYANDLKEKKGVPSVSS